jgi:hypothetical protein
MTDDPVSSQPRDEGEPADSTCKNEDERTAEILEQARQNMKRAAVSELAGEKISRELLNFRLRVRNDA